MWVITYHVRSHRYHFLFFIFFICPQRLQPQVWWFRCWGAKINIQYGSNIISLTAKQCTIRVGGISWVWGGDYVQTYKRIAERKWPLLCSATLRLWNPLSPQIVYKTDDKPMWSISHGNLKETLDEAWDDLNENTDEILTHIKSLPGVSGSGLNFYFGCLILHLHRRPLVLIQRATIPQNHK